MVRFINFVSWYSITNILKRIKETFHIVTNIISNTGYPKQNKSMQMSMN